LSINYLQFDLIDNEQVNHILLRKNYLLLVKLEDKTKTSFFD